MGITDSFHGLYARIPEAGCWIWLGSIIGDGYGVYDVGDGWKVRAHRLSFELHVGPIPRGLLVCHRCDVPACVNPAHLFLGTVADNSADMRAKGRSNRGEINAHAKLTGPDVLQIRELLAAGTAVTSLARQFGVSQSAVSLIKARKTWMHV